MIDDADGAIVQSPVEVGSTTTPCIAVDLPAAGPAQFPLRSAGRTSRPGGVTHTQLTLPLGWCQRWRDRQHSWRPISQGGFDRRRYECVPIPIGHARTFVGTHHYAGPDSWPAAKIAFGMFEASGELVGAAVIGIPVRARVLTSVYPTLHAYEESAELSRLVLLDRIPANAETHFISRFFRYLRAHTALRGIVAFSDPYPRRRRDGTITMPGHFGGIYQAGSAKFLGRSRARTLAMLPDATVLNDRSRSKVIAGERGWRYVVDRLVALGATPPANLTRSPGQAWLDLALAEVGAQRIRHGGNLRYAFPLHRSVTLGMPTQPYPKRDGS